jgi:hypothetical protein
MGHVARDGGTVRCGMVARELETADRDEEKGAEDRLQSACEKGERGEGRAPERWGLNCVWSILGRTERPTGRLCCSVDGPTRLEEASVRQVKSITIIGTFATGSISLLSPVSYYVEYYRHR